MHKSDQIMDKILETVITELITEQGFSHTTERALATLKEGISIILTDICSQFAKLSRYSTNMIDCDSILTKMLVNIYFEKGAYHEQGFKEFLYRQKKLNRQFPNLYSTTEPLLYKLNLIPNITNTKQTIGYEFKEISGSRNYEKTVFKDEEIDKFVHEKPYIEYKKKEWESLKNLNVDDLYNEVKGECFFTDEEIGKALVGKKFSVKTGFDKPDTGLLDLLCQ